MGALLELDAVSRSFGGLRAVQRVSLAVEEGEILGLIGPNGAGKSTLFDLIAGASRPDAGRVRLGGEDVTRLGPHQRCRRGIARTFQQARPFPELTALANVALGLVYGRGPGVGPAPGRGRGARSAGAGRPGRARRGPGPAPHPGGAQAPGAGPGPGHTPPAAAAGRAAGRAESRPRCRRRWP